MFSIIFCTLLRSILLVPLFCNFTLERWHKTLETQITSTMDALSAKLRFLLTFRSKIVIGCLRKHDFLMKWQIVTFETFGCVINGIDIQKDSFWRFFIHRKTFSMKLNVPCQTLSGRLWYRPQLATAAVLATARSSRLSLGLSRLEFIVVAKRQHQIKSTKLIFLIN